MIFILGSIFLGSFSNRSFIYLTFFYFELWDYKRWVIFIFGLMGCMDMVSEDGG